MNDSFSVYGDAASRTFSYTDRGVYHEFTAPGGAAMLARLLHEAGLAESPALEGSLRREHLELARFGAGYLAIGHRYGTEPGTAYIDTGSGANRLLFGGAAKVPEIEMNTPVLWASQFGLPDRSIIEAVADRLFLMLDADVLREAGALVSRAISWERTATELVWQLRNNPGLSYLLGAQHLLITCAEDGAVHLTRGGLRARLVLSNGDGEGALRGRVQGHIDDAFVVMTAAVACQFGAVMAGEPLRVRPVLKSAETLMLSGYSEEQLSGASFALVGIDDAGDDDAFDIPVRSGQSCDPDSWCVSNSVGDKRIFDIARDYVLNGEKVIEGLPRFTSGALTTVDRFEIEAFQDIQNLILAYAGGASVRPLSIAVFGSPGSGKSFGVTQIAKNVLPGKVEKLEFNVSQMTSQADMGAAFQKVRDVILEGKLPLVFFDEFDSDRDGAPLGWIKGFLMPMQDGRFRDETGEHPLGKCVLVFAGGTAASFEEFTAPMRSDDAALKAAFRGVKGPDFVSRLRGTINVLGPNQVDESDKNYILRRALLLRSLCERKLGVANGHVPISGDILWAMLLVPRYKHGARSMEAILDMSTIEGGVWEPVSLPDYSQLELHVDADAFLRLVLRVVILGSNTEQLAQAIHADYCAKQTARGQGDAPYLRDWDDLPEQAKEANRGQARSIAEKLSALGFTYDAGDTPFVSVEAFDDETTLLLAQNEHIRWMAERASQGWIYGEIRNEVAKTHPLMVPWDDLPAEEKQKDIDVADNIIPLLKSIGLRVYKTI